MRVSRKEKTLIKLIENEWMKLILRRKLILVFSISTLVILAFAYGLHNQYEKSISVYVKGDGKNYDWTPSIQQEIHTLKNQLQYGSTKESEKQITSISIEQYEYYLKEKISPLSSSGMKFSETILAQSVMLLLPLFIILFSADIVSSEFSSKTIKILLTRAVPRWKILLSKYICTVLLSGIVVGEMSILSLIVGRIAFHTWGFLEPVAVRFQGFGAKQESVYIVKMFQWQYALLIYALCIFVAIIIASISFSISIFVKNTAASIGIMMAALIGGSILQIFLKDWPTAKYFFSVNLSLPQYLNINYDQSNGLNLFFSMGILIIWGVACMLAGFYAFLKQDILV